jgi:AGZA family xanthine/uracil permease-like MFS transporter
MPFTYSIAYGLIAGIISYIVLNTIVWVIEKASGGRIKPADKEYKDFWTYKIEGGVLPPWLTRAAKGKKDFWRPYEDVEHNNSAPTGTHFDGQEAPVEGQKSARGPEVGELRDGSTSSDGEKVKV